MIVVLVTFLLAYWLCEDTIDYIVLGAGLIALSFAVKFGAI